MSVYGRLCHSIDNSFVKESFLGINFSVNISGVVVVKNRTQRKISFTVLMAGVLQNSS